MLQFYDWSFRHDKLVSTETIYEDMMGKTEGFFRHSRENKGVLMKEG